MWIVQSTDINNPDDACADDYWSLELLSLHKSLSVALPHKNTPLEHGCTTTTRAPINCEGNGYYFVQLEVLIDQICRRKHEGIKQMKFLCVLAR